jgi:tetratricopeptide (TPR) repeat protein
MCRGQFGVGREVFQRAVALAERYGDPHGITTTHALYSAQLLLLGEWGQARLNLARSLAAGRYTWAYPLALNVLGAERTLSGAWDEATTALDEAIAIAAAAEDLERLRYAAYHRAYLDLLQGNPEAARARLVPLLDRPGLQEFDVTMLLPLLALAYLELGDRTKASRTVQEALARARPEGVQLVLVDALQVQVLILIQQGQLGDAEQVA